MGEFSGIVRPDRSAVYTVVRIALGLLLLTAAGLKGYELATEPVAQTGLLTSPWFLIGVVEFELFFGLWLLTGLYRRLTWRVAILCFSAFACVSLYKAVSGEATCGCFGRVAVSPWYTLILDAVAVLALCCWPPETSGVGLATGSGQTLLARVVRSHAAVRLLGLTVAVSSILVAISSWWFQHEDRREQVTPPTDSVSVRLDPASIDLGMFSQYEQRTLPFGVINGTDREWRIGRVAPSCGCTLVDVSQATVPPRGRVELHFTIKAPAGTDDVIRKIIELQLEEVATGKSVRRILSIEGEMDRDSQLVAVPHAVDFGTFLAGEEQRRTVLFRGSRAIVDALPNLIRCNPHCPTVVTVKTKQAPAQRSAKEVVLLLSSNAGDASTLATEMRLIVEGAHKRAFHLPLRAQTILPYIAMPSQLYVFQREGKAAEASFRIVSTQRRTPKIAEIAAPFPFSYRIAEDITEDAVTVVADLGASLRASAMVKGQLRVLLDDEASSSVVLPVVAMRGAMEESP